MSGQRIRLADVAKEAGISAAAVSLALKNHPRISEKTKARVQKICKDLGYQPDPVAKALVNKRTGAAGAENYIGTLALLESRSYIERRKLSTYSKIWHQQLEEVCRKMGYRIDCFAVEPEKEKQSALSRVLDARGISGLIIFGFNEEIHHWAIQWKKFAAVSYSGALHEHFIHNIHSNSYQDVYDAVLRLKEKGYCRPGYVIPASISTYDHLEAGFSAAVKAWRISKPVPRLVAELDEPADADKFISWFFRYKPDVLVTNYNDKLEEILGRENIRIPQDVGCMCLDVFPGMEHLSGLIQSRKSAFQIAVDMLHGMLMRHEYGPPEQPMCIQIPAVWNEGATL